MLEQIVKDIAATVKENVQAGIKTVSEKFEIRFKALEERLDKLPAPEKGEPGESVTIDDVRPIVEELVAAIPPAKDGIDGQDGKSVTLEDIQPIIDEAVKSIPVPKDGKDGVDGTDGIAPTADEVAKSMEGLFSKWALEFERKADLVLEKSVDRLPKPKDGVDGRDALDIEDFDLSLGEDGRTVTASLKRGETVIEKSIKLATILDRGVYKSGQEYEKGDGVTYGGCFWICQKDGAGTPGSGDDWRLSVKRGRDGRESVKLIKQDKVKV